MMATTVMERVRQRGCSLMKFSTQVAENSAPILAELKSAVLKYPTAKSPLCDKPWNLKILSPECGGHVILGPNAAGKSLISSTIAHRGDSNFLVQGSFCTNGAKWHSNAVAHVSFESHEELLATGGTASKAISRGGLLSKAAQYLVVRFGLYPLLHRQVSDLSTGEIRKVLLVRALADRPKLLLLDNAFDGLDVESRENLKELVSKTIQGFKLDMLVQSVSAKETARTQVVMMTHRAEEIVDEIETASFWIGNELQTINRQRQTGSDLLKLALSREEHNEKESEYWEDNKVQWNDPKLPLDQEVANLWSTNRSHNGIVAKENRIVFHNLTVYRGQTALLKDLTWTVKRKEHWLVAGSNGAGKSTLSRLLAKEDDSVETMGNIQVLTDSKNNLPKSYRATRKNVGWVSTELHLATAKTMQTTRDIISQGGSIPADATTQVASWLCLQPSDEFLSLPFSSLSQGQQKLVLIASAIASRPDILVLDEPCQGLDLNSRNRVLGICQKLCQVTDMNLIYITHHLEEVLPGISNVIHLVDGEVAFSGKREDYNPRTVQNKDNHSAFGYE